MRGLLLFTTAVLLACGTAANAQQIYRWVDDKGITHFGAKPPENSSAQRVDAKAPRVSKEQAAAANRPAAAPDAAQQALDKQVKNEVMLEEAAREKYCKDIRMNLAQLRNNPRLRYADEKGEVHHMTEQERQKRIAETEQSIKDTCLN